MSRLPRVLVLAVLWIGLGGWIGAFFLFGVVVAPTAFEVLPSNLAGQLVGPILTALNLYGVAAGFGIAGLGLWLRRGWPAALLSSALALVCLYSHFGVTAEISELRPMALGPAPPPGAQLRFADLHQLSVTLYVATGVGAIVLAFLHARSQVLPRGE